MAVIAFYMHNLAFYVQYFMVYYISIIRFVGASLGKLFYGSAVVRLN